jgi:hypothetical protein
MTTEQNKRESRAGMEVLQPSAVGVATCPVTVGGTPVRVAARNRGDGRPASGLLRIVGFFCCFIGLLFATDRAINYGLRRIDTSAYGVTNRILSGKVNAEIVVSGSSRALTHYDSTIIANVTGHTAFNIGRNGSQTDMQLAVLRAYLKHNAKPRLVVHNLDLFSFVMSQEIYDAAQYMPYLHEDAIYDAVRKIYPDAWKWKYFPLYGYVVEDMRFAWVLGLKRVAGLQPPEDHVLGYVARNTRWTGDFEKFRAANPMGVTFKIEPAGVRVVTELVELCHSQQIPLLMVYSPVYYEMQSLERNRRAIFAKFHEICDRYGVRFWDFGDSSIARDRANFYNSQHLNAVGASAFSLEFAQRLAREGILVDASSATSSGAVAPQQIPAARE